LCPYRALSPTGTITASGNNEQYILGQLFCLFSKAVRNPLIETVGLEPYGVGGRVFYFGILFSNFTKMIYLKETAVKENKLLTTEELALKLKNKHPVPQMRITMKLKNFFYSY